MSLLLLGKLKDVAKIRCRELRRQQTPAEVRMWHLLRNRKYHGLKFNRQHPIFHDLDGRETFLIADFFCHELRLVIELDGSVHADTGHADAHRDRTLSLLGFTVLRFTNDIALEHPYRILQAIDEIRSRQNPSPS
ncbi:MAG: endonuclease domain-containing protein [Bacteroidetes bacterium]|nr:endonuclease domain-containing protein [Bacteroidota bacterium]